ncbi:MAG: hypothetical protein K9N51_06770, partial [Candidatus Pacebacteria bacterium]|nr:hypothetical protein [Candidatus Paceibacterota bacterium]
MSREKNRVRVSVVFGIAVVALSLGCPSFVKAQEEAMNFPLAEQLRVKKGSPVDFTFDLPEDKAVISQVRLLMDARIEWEREIGNAYAMKIT